MLKKFVSITTAAMLSLTLIACSGQEPATDTTAEPQTAESAKTEEAATTQDAKAEKVEKAAAQTTAATAIGDTSSTATKVKITNGLGSDITSFAMKNVKSTSWGKNQLKDNEVIPSGASVDLGIAADDDASAYDLQLIDANGKEIEIKDVALATMSEAKLQVENGVGYVTYKDLNGVEGSTKSAGAEASSGDDASTAKTTSDNSYDASTDAASADDNDSYQEPTYEGDNAQSEPVAEEYYAEPAPSYEEAYVEPVVEEAPAQAADDCTRDNIVLDVE